MKKLNILFFCLALYLPSKLVAQTASPAASGIYIDLGKDIPKQLAYTISRRTVKSKDWQELKTLRFEQDSAIFYADLTKAIAHYQIFSLPETSLKSNIWKMISKAATTDSVLYYGFTPPYREALQTAYYDAEAQPNVDYEYRITTQVIGSQEKIAEKVIKSRYPAVIKKDFKMKTLTIASFNKKMVLKYMSNSLQKPAGIVVLRGTYMQTDFSPIANISGMVNDKDTLLYMAVDSLIESEKVYQYVAVPVDELGNEGIPSDTIRLANVAFNNSATVRSFKTISLEKESAIKLMWKLDKTPNMQGVNIYRAEAYDSQEYQLIGSASATDSVFIDTKVHPVKNYFYTIVPSTQYGDGYPSARVVGMLKANKTAKAPERLSAEIVGNKVRLSWKRPEFYTRGYYVFRSKGGLDTLKQVTDLIITDSVNVVYDDVPPLSEKGLLYTYAIKAVNTSYDISPLSEQINITTPLKITITTPINVKARAFDDHKVMIYWDNKADKNYLAFNVYRKNSKVNVESKFEKINPNVILSTNNFYLDSTVVIGSTYEYAIQAISVNEQLSAMSTPVVFALAEKKLLPAFNLSAYTNDSGSILINWDKTQQSEVTGYKIYRLKGNQKELLGSVDKLIDNFEDKKASKTELNTYVVSCISKTTESEVSDPVSIRLK